VILHFDPRTSYILLDTDRYSVATVKVDPYKFDNITIYQNDKPFYSVYIFDHMFESATAPKIVVLQKQKAANPTAKPLTPINPNNVSAQI